MVGGHIARIADHPWMAYVEYEVATGAWICSGTVVAPRVVLTAGHCVEEIDGLVGDLKGGGALAPASTYRVVTGTAAPVTASQANTSRVVQDVVNPSFAPYHAWFAPAFWAPGR